MTTETPKNRPVYEVRAGTIRAAVWANDTAKGKRYNVTFERLYKDGDSWKSSSSFSSWDLVDVVRVAVIAEMWANERLAEQQEQSDPTAPAV